VCHPLCVTLLSLGLDLPQAAMMPPGFFAALLCRSPLDRSAPPPPPPRPKRARTREARRAMAQTRAPPGMLRSRPRSSPRRPEAGLGRTQVAIAQISHTVGAKPV